MPSQSDLIRRFETAPLAELLKVLHRPSAGEAAALKAWLGVARYDRLRKTVLQPSTRSDPKKRKNVVVLPGIMGSELTVRNGKDNDVIWVNLFRLGVGRIKQLRLKADGTPENDSFASDIMRKYYIEMLTGLARDHNVQTFCYDWRRDLKDSAVLLDTAIQQWFGPSSEVYFVAHSMGGLVVRTWIRHHAARWNKGCRLVMLGTPNHGSFAIPQVITGAHKMVKQLAYLDVKHNLQDFTKILNTFPGSLQMLPSPHVMESMEPLYRSSTWSGRGVSQTLLDRALRQHDSLVKVIDTERMIYLAGVGHLTPSDFRDWNAMDRIEDGYIFTPEGDETVPHQLGFLHSETGKVPVRFSRAKHGALPNDEGIVKAVLEYLATHDIKSLPDVASSARSLPVGRAAARAVQEEWERESAAFAARLQRDRSRNSPAKDAESVRLEESLLDGFLGDGQADSTARGAKSAAASNRPATPLRATKADATIQVAIHFEFIETFGNRTIRGVPSVDFLAVGHYQGVEPQFAELALDLRLSKALGLIPENETIDSVDRALLFITQSTRRAAFSMRLGEPCILPLPGNGPRIALAGLGLPGTFGRAELHVMVQEFIATLAQLGCKHLGTVLIGAGAENMDIPTAARAWLESLHSLATAGLAKMIPRITFVQNSAMRTREMHEAFSQVLEQNNNAWGSSIEYLGTTPEQEALSAHEEAEIKEEETRRIKRARNVGATQPNARETAPTFINVSKVRGGYEFSAITNEASVPQRIIKVDPRLVEDVCQRLATSSSADDQREWGAVLEQLLIPRDLRARLFSSASSVVFAVDAATARIPFEMLSLPAVHFWQEAQEDEKTKSDTERFLGMANGFGVTRQFRTTFAPAPEAPRGANRDLRILIVADPAEDAPLAGAQEEAVAVGEIAERLRREYENLTGGVHTVKVTSLVGPSEATRAEVVKQLLRVQFDALHFAGHCYFDKEAPAESGWIFNAERNERITAAELSRLDRVPPFIFSNACESGVTPDRFGAESLGVAPAFAEAFFQRGVRNFVCTAWPVDDAAALLFATRFYESFLGLGDADGLHPVTIREALLLARRAIASSEEVYGGGTWGAYQHYGNPSFRFLRQPIVPTRDP